MRSPTYPNVPANVWELGPAVEVVLQKIEKIKAER